MTVVVCDSGNTPVTESGVIGACVGVWPARSELLLVVVVVWERFSREWFGAGGVSSFLLVAELEHK